MAGSQGEKCHPKVLSECNYIPFITFGRTFKRITQYFPSSMLKLEKYCVISDEGMQVGKKATKLGGGTK